MKTEMGVARTRMARRVVVLAVGLLLSASIAMAQPFTIPRFDFSFSNPGARSMGFAGAFAALADDATAAFGNPAGLVQLTKTEVSAELRLWDRSPTFLAGGRADSQASGVGVDTATGLEFARGNSSTLSLSYAAVVLPKGRWSVAFYGNQLARFAQAAESQGFFFDDSPPAGAVGRFPGSREEVDLEVKTAGVAVGWRVNDQLSLGLGVVYADASMATRFDAFLPDDDSQAAQFGTITFRPERLLSSTNLDLSGDDVTMNVGLLWRATPQVSAGVYHRQGARVDGAITLTTGPAVPFFNVTRSAATFDVPDVTGFGLAYRGRGGRLTVASEIDHVGYGGIIGVADEEDLGLEARSYEDAWEVHIGAEYALVQRVPILAFRVGSWVEANEGEGALRDRSFVHWTAGVGIVARRFQVDLALDLAAEVDTASLSVIYTF